MSAPESHIPFTHLCPCHQCAKHRLVYALMVARNKGDITEQDYELGITIISTILAVEML